MTRMFAIAGLVAFVTGAGATRPAIAQTDKPPSAAELLARVREQERELAAQRERLQAQEAEIAAQKLRIEEMSATLNELAKAVAAQAEEPPTPGIQERLARLEETVKKPEMPADVVTAGDFPGSIRIPGTAETLKVGGLARTSVIQTLAPLGSDDRFLTNSIPVGDEAEGQVTRFQTTVRPSRLNFEFRTPRAGRPLRAFIEGDFAADGDNVFRLRHSYLQFRDFLVGQTWSTFSDLEAEPEDLDFEGMNALNVLRQTQLRWSPHLGRFSQLVFALEDADASITGGSGANRWPDLVVGRRWHHERGHQFVALSLRDIRGQLDTDPAVIGEDLGWAVTVSGTQATKLREGNRWLYQITVGEGSARYINDLNALGGQDAAFDDLGELHVLGAFGAYVAYEHHWPDWRKFRRLRSSAVLGIVNVATEGFQPTDAYNHTERFSLNLVTSPLDAIDLGLQVVAGRRTNKDGNSGASSQIQLMAQYRF